MFGFTSNKEKILEELGETIFKISFKKFITDNEPILDLVPNKINFSDYYSEALNSKKHLVVPLHIFIKEILEYLLSKAETSFVFTMEQKEHLDRLNSNRSDEETNEILLAFFNDDYQENERIIDIIKVIFKACKKEAEKTGRILFLGLDKIIELRAHLMNGNLKLIIQFVGYFDNICINTENHMTAIKPLIPNREIVNWNVVDISASKDIIFQNAILNTLVNRLHNGKFLDILEVIKKHKDEILSLNTDKKQVINFAEEFCDWYEMELFNPNEFRQIEDKLKEIDITLNIHNSKRDFSKINKINVDKLNEEKKLLTEKIEDFKAKISKIKISDPLTYPEWVESYPGAESFVEYLREVHKLKIDISLFGLESRGSVEEIKETKATLKEKLRNIDDKIKSKVIGQDKNIIPLTTAIKRWFVGIRTNKPIGSFLFVGPTGVGKTETAKILAEELFNNSLITLDMSEYQSSIDVSKIIGIAPGYVGYETGGGLLEKVKDNPRSIILFDEIEKAHPRIFDLLLQLLDEGRLTDNKGEVVSFKECLIICTSNASNEHIESYQKEFNEKEINRKDIIKIFTATQDFRKELLTRFTDILKFNSLDIKTLEIIFNQKLELELDTFRNLKDFSRNLVIKITDEERVKIKNFILSITDKSLGAREIQRLIQEKITSGILDKIVEIELNDIHSDKDIIMYPKYDYKNDKVIIEVSSEDSETKEKEIYSFEEVDNIIYIDNFNKDMKLTPSKEFALLFKTWYPYIIDLDYDNIVFDRSSEYSKDYFDMYNIKFKFKEDSSRTINDLYNELEYLEANVGPEFKMQTLGGKIFSLGDGDDRLAVTIDNNVVLVWFRWWKEEEK